MTVLDEIREMVASAYGVDVQHVMAETRFGEDLDDSMEIVELMIECEAKFGIQIKDEEVYNLLTVGEFAAFIERKIVEAGS